MGNYMRSTGEFKIVGGWDRLIFLLAGVSTLLAYLYLPTWYYHLLKYLICGSSAYGVYINKNKVMWMIIFCILAVIYNPFLSVKLHSNEWRFLDLITAYVYFVFFCKSCMYKRYWIVSLVIIWSVFVLNIGLTYFVNHYLPHGPEYDTGEEACPDDGSSCSEVYEEDLRGVSIPKWAKSFKNDYIYTPMLMLLFAGLFVGFSKMNKYGAVLKTKFFETDPNGAIILDDLIKKGILEELSSTEVRLNRLVGETPERPLEMQSSSFNEVWYALQQYLRDNEES